jgi:hypothetical protein
MTLQLYMIGKGHAMPDTTLSQITLVYRSETQQFKSVSQAIHFLRQERIKLGWFHKVQAAVDLVKEGTANQTRNMKGDKFHVIMELEQLAAEVKKANV